MRRVLRWALALAVGSALGCNATHVAVPAPTPSSLPPTEEAPPTVVVSATDVRFEGDAAPIFGPFSDTRQGADASIKLNGADDFFVKPFGEAVTKRRASGKLTDTLRIVVAPTISFRLVVELLFTAGRMNVKQFDLEEAMPRARGFRVVRPVDVPDVPSSAGTSLDLVLLFSSDGVGMAISGRNVQPGCDHHPLAYGAHLTFLRVGGKLDLGAVSACAENAKKSAPELASNDTLTLVSSAKDPPSFDEIAAVAVAMGGADGKLFRDIRLAMVP